MKVAFIAGECDPFVKTGGLGDVVGALPKYLKRDGIEACVVIPLYGDIPELFKKKFEFIKWYMVPMSWRNQYCGVFKYLQDGVTYYFLDHEYYFKRKGIYGHGDDGERFSFFDRAALMLFKEIGLKPDIIHCHDWHTGMIPVMLKSQFKYDDFYKDIKTVFTIHNLKFQGVFRRDMLGDCLNLDDSLYRDGTVSFYDGISFMQGALKTSDKISTVSWTYSHEIEDPFFGEQLEGIIRERSNDVWGIVNGIDYDVYNPETDLFIEKHYGKNTIHDKKINKTALQRELGLNEDPEVPVIGIVSRLTSQKGLDIVRECMEDFVARGIQLVVLGTGERQYEDYFKYLQYKYKGFVSANIKFDNALAHKIYAGSDMFLMPSLFEPCGLGQLIALRYGTVPIVRETGGLRDTVSFYVEETGEGNGFSFGDFTSYQLKRTLNIAIDYYYNKKQWRKIVKNAMDSDNSWIKSAKEYERLYNQLMS